MIKLTIDEIIEIEQFCDLWLGNILLNNYNNGINIYNNNII